VSGLEPISDAGQHLSAFARRKVLAGGLGVAASVVLAGCGDEAGSDAEPSADDSDPEPKATQSEPSDSGDAGSQTSTVLGPTADIAVGGGVIFAADKVVVTQPSKGVFRAFDVTCTHAGCPVDEVTDTINCPCHGSMFSLEDGAPVSGPAEAPLATKDVTVKDGTLLLG
jgi:Rieske Fe-S protein